MAYKLKWKYKSNGELKSPPAIGEDGTIYVCSWDYYMYAIYPNGTLRWKLNTWSWTETSPDTKADRLKKNIRNRIFFFITIQLKIVHINVLLNQTKKIRE